MINVSGHRMGTAEVEAALVSHPKVSEAAVVGFPHNLLRNADSRSSFATGCARRSGRSLRQSHPACPRLAQNAVGQDHAPHLLRKVAEDDFLQSRRYFDAGPSRCGRRPHPKPAEQVEFITISASTRADQRGRPAVDGSHHGLAAWLLPHHPSR